MKKLIFIFTVIGICLVVVLLNVTTPVSAGPFGILIIFISGYVSLLGIISYFLYVGSRVAARLSTALITKKPFEPLSFKRSYYFSTVVASAPIMLIGLQSVGTVGVYELLLIVIFVIIGCLYVSKRIN
jgi:hypothetical protein